MKSAKCRGACIDDLPDPVLVTILAIAYPDSEGGNRLLQCTEVCKRWRELVQNMVASLTLPAWFSPRFAMKRIAKLPSLRSLTMDGTLCRSRELVAFFISVGQDCRQLRELTLIKVLYFDEEAAATLFWHVTTLQSLCIKNTFEPIPLLFMWRLTSLEKLHIEDSSITKQSSRKVDQLTSLRTLVLKNVKQSVSPITSLTNLETLELQSVLRRHILPSVRGLSKLRTLEASGYFFLSLDLSDLTSLETLNLQGEWDRHGPRSLSGLRALTNLRSLDLKSLVLQQSTDIPTLSLLEQLAITVDGRQPPTSVSTLTALRRLTISGVNLDPAQSQLPSLRGLSRLTQVQISSNFSSFCNGRERLQEVASLTDLRVLLIDVSTEFLALRLDSAAVTELELVCRGHDLDLSNLNLLRNLINLFLVGDDHTPLVPLAGHFPSLQELRVVTFRAGLFGLEGSFPALKVLKLEWLDDVKLSGLAGAASLQKLKIFGCSIPSLPPLGELRSLRSLEILTSESMSEIPSLAGLGMLEQLKLEDCLDVTRIVDLSGLSALKRLTIVGLPKLTMLPSFRDLVQLESLRISCHRLREVPELSELAALRLLDLAGCSELERIPPLRNLSRLLYADLRCIGLTAAPDTDGLSEDLDVTLLAKFNS